MNTTPPEKNPEVEAIVEEFFSTEDEFGYSVDTASSGGDLNCKEVVRAFLTPKLRTIITPLIQDRDARVREEYSPVTFIADLYQLKQTLVRPQFSYREYVEPNITYSVIETLIATFLDKYKVPHEEIAQEMRNRALTPSLSDK